MQEFENGKPETAQEPEQAILITEDMLVPARPKDPRIPFEKTMSGFPLLISVIIIVNVVLFAWEVATGALTSRDTVIAAGALYRDKVLQGEYWRLISAAFLHGGAGHLFGNCAAMYILGMANEHAFGVARTGAIYLVAALAGSTLSLIMSPGPGIGASGAVFGLMGSIVVLFYNNRSRFYLRDRGIGTFVGALAILQIVLGFTSPYIDNWAHLGGLIGGGVMAFLLKPALLATEGSGQMSARTKGLLAGMAAVLCIGAFVGGGFLWSLEAATYLSLDKPRLAAEAATRSLSANATNSYAYFIRAGAYLEQKRLQQAIADLNRYTQLNPQDAGIASQAAHLCSEHGLFAEAIAYHSQAIRLAPRNTDYLNSRGYNYILVRNYQAARADFDTLLKLDGTYAMAYGNIGLLYAIEGDYPKALTHLRKAYSMDSSQVPLQKLIEAIDHEDKRRKAEAIASYGQFVAKTKNRSSWLAEIRFAEERLAVLKKTK